MSSQGRIYLEKAISTVGAMLVLIATIQSATLADSLRSTTESPALSQATLTTLINGTMEEPRVLRLHKPCSDEHADFCENDGQCMYPQDTSTPFCICRAEYSGVRCMFYVDGSQAPPDGEEVMRCVGVAAFILVFIAIVIYCCVRRRCKKSRPLIKSHGSENSV